MQGGAPRQPCRPVARDLCYSRRAFFRRVFREANRASGSFGSGRLRTRRLGGNVSGECRRGIREANRASGSFGSGRLRTRRPRGHLSGAVQRRDAREAEGGALLRRYTRSNAYRGFESLSLRHEQARLARSSEAASCAEKRADCSARARDAKGATMSERADAPGSRNVTESLSLRHPSTGAVNLAGSA